MTDEAMSLSFRSAPSVLHSARPDTAAGQAWHLHARDGIRRHAPAPGMHALVALQQADGFWEMTNDLARILDRKFSEIEAALAGGSGSPSDLHRAWATALAIAWLRLYAPADEEEWNLLSRKARRWLDEVAATLPGGQGWIEEGLRFMSA